MLDFAAVLVLLMAGSPPATLRNSDAAQGLDEDRAAIEQAAHDYLEGWYAGDVERIGRALHPDLAKRYVQTLASGRQVVYGVGREVMLEMTRAGGGSKSPAATQPISVEILELGGGIAAAKATSAEYVELLSLAKCNGHWAIVNVLWRFQDGAQPRERER